MITVSCLLLKHQELRGLKCVNVAEELSESGENLSVLENASTHYSDISNVEVLSEQQRQSVCAILASKPTPTHQTM